MGHEVLLTEGAERDLADIYDYMVEFEPEGRADRWLTRLLELADGLSVVPQRGTHPKELLALGIRDYRQIVFGPYRMIYRVIDERVLVYLVADGRRDMQSLLQRRLLGR